MADTAFIGLGSNLGDGNRILRDAWKRIGETEGIETAALSHPYRTAPVGMESSNQFTNAVGMVLTTLSPCELLRVLLDVESVFGRRRDPSAAGYQDRPLDLDILCFGDCALSTPVLVLPHPRLDDRLFVLAPFAEISPDFRMQPQTPTIAQRYAHLCERLLKGEISRQEIKMREWEE